MGTVNFSGIGTGIDWSELIEAEIQVRRSHRIAPIEDWKVSWETKISVFDQLRSLLTDVQDAAEAMDTTDELRSYLALSSSESTVEAHAAGATAPGTHTIEVNQLASTEVEIHGGLDDSQTVVNNTGGTLEFAYAYAGTSVVVEVADGMMLAELADLINHDATNPGVTAYILDDGGGTATSHHLVLRGDDTGADYTITIDAGVTTLEGDWSNLSADASSGASSVTVAETSAFHQYQAVLVNDDDSSAELHIVDSIGGTTLTLQGSLSDDFTTAQNAYVTPRGMGSGLADAATAGSSQITVDDVSHFQVGKSVIVADGSNYQELVISAVDAGTDTVTFSTTLSNDYASDGYVTQLEGGRKFTFEDTDFTQTQAAQNAQLRVDGYPAGSWIERETNSVSNVIQGVTLTLKTTTGASPVTVTVTEDPEGAKTKIQSLVDAYNAAKEFLNEATSYDADTETAGVLLGNYAADLIETQLRSILISVPPGFDQDADTFSLLGQVGIETVGDGSEMELGTLVIDEDRLDEALAEDFEAVIRLFASDFAGYSDSGYLTFYQASDLLTAPGTYDVQADFDGSGNLIAGRFKLATESVYRDANVDSPYVYGTSGNPENAIWVRAAWDGSSSTQSAVVRVAQGIAGQIGDVLDSVLDSTEGLIHNLDESYGDIINQIDDRIGDEEQRLEMLRQRLTEKYARLERLLWELQATESWTSSMISGLSGPESSE
jgi:flagellar capping protein FliD